MDGAGLDMEVECKKEKIRKDGLQKPMNKSFQDRVATGGPGAQTSGEVRARPGPGLWRPLPPQLWGRRQSPAGWRMIWRLSEKAGGKRGTWRGRGGEEGKKVLEGAVSFKLTFGERRAV